MTDDTTYSHDSTDGPDSDGSHVSNPSCNKQEPPAASADQDPQSAAEFGRRSLLKTVGAAAVAGVTGIGVGLETTTAATEVDAQSGSRAHPPTSSTCSPTLSASPAMGALPDSDAPTDRFVRGNTNFGLALQQRLADEKPNTNRFLSPYSLGVAFAMTYAGARGTTREQIAEPMGFHPRDKALHRTVAALRADLPIGKTKRAPTPPKDTPSGDSAGLPFRLLGANALWMQAGLPVRETYTELLKHYYAVGLGTVNFKSNSKAARKRINRWVKARTRGEIPELTPAGSLSRRTRLVLANAIYFRANWTDTFAETNTELATFTALDGSRAQVPMMHESVKIPYAHVSGHQIAQLPYDGDDVDMILLLPAEGQFHSVERSLDAARLAELLAATEPQEGKIALPRFQFRSRLSLPKYLKAMGMKRAFSHQANFMGIVKSGRVSLDDVFHEAAISVDEQGTEAAAATGVEAVAVSAPINPFTMTLDRPFLFAIRHRPTGEVLFLGRLVNAGAAQP